MGEPKCPVCGETLETGCVPSRCPAWTTEAVYDKATGAWVPVDDDGFALDGSQP